MIKKITGIILILIFLFSFCKVQAVTIGNIINGAENFVNTGKNPSNEALNGELIQETSSLIYNILLIIGVCIATIIGAVLGIQFITGSVEQKVKVQESLVPFIVGCIIIFGAFGIWKLVINLLK